MGLSEEFTGKAEAVVEQLHTLVDDNLPWRSDLQNALAAINFTPEQEQTIRAAATFGTFQNMTDDSMNDFATRLTHAFRDSIGNATMLLEMTMLEEDQEETLNALTQIRSFIHDLEHNYPLMLGGEVPETVQSVLDTYKDDVLPQISEMIDELAQSTGIDPESIPQKTSYQHITAMPEDVFATAITNE